MPIAPPTTAPPTVPIALPPVITAPAAAPTPAPAIQHSHLKAAEHNEAASVAHKEAAKHVDGGDAKQAALHAAVAHGHTIQAHEHGKTALSTIANAALAKK